MTGVRRNTIPTAIDSDRECLTCGERLTRRGNEAASMFRKRWFCSRTCGAWYRERLWRNPPSYGGEAYAAAVEQLIRAHPVEFDALYRTIERNYRHEQR